MKKPYGWLHSIMRSGMGAGSRCICAYCICRFLFFTVVAADAACHYIIKWLGSNDKGYK